MKLLRRLFLFLLMVIPTIALAYTQEEAQDKLDSIPNEISVNFVDPSNYVGYKIYTREDLEPWDTDGKSEDEINQYLNEIKQQEYLDYLDVINRYLQYDTGTIVCDNNCNIQVVSSDTLKASISYSSGSAYSKLEKEIHINYASANDNDVDKARKILDGLDYKYYLRGLNTYSSIYHYGWLGEQEYGDFRILSSYEGLKEFMEMHNEYDYDVFFNRGGGDIGFQERYIYIALKKDDVVLAYKEIILREEEVILVDKDLPGTPYEKALNLLKEFFDNKVSVEYNGDFYAETDEQLNYLKEIVNYNNISNLYSGEFLIDGKRAFVAVAETDKDHVSKGYSKSTDYSTGVNVYTESYDVPTDSHIITQDVTDKDYVIKAGLFGHIKFLKAFDINLFKGFNGLIIKQIDRGIEVYLPIDTNGIYNIYHIKEDGSLGEKYDSEIVEIEGKKYIKFITFHFSTYGIVQEPENPQTGDNINEYISLLFIGLCGAYSFIKYLNKSIN